MSKGLESLERIKSRYNDRVCIDILEDFDLVEKELKEYEEMKAIKGTTTFDKAIEDTLINACPNVAKKLKALEVIKPLVDLTKGTNYCWLWLGLNGVQISQEEFDLLKEVLL